MLPSTRINTEVVDNKLSPEVLISLSRVCSPNISPDSQNIVYTVKEVDLNENKTIGQIYTMSIDGNNNKKITSDQKSKNKPVFLNDGRIMFMMMDEETKQMQLFTMNSDGEDVKRVSNVKTGVEDFLLSPDNTKIIYVTRVKNIPAVKDTYPDLLKTSGLIATDLMFQHWDTWMDTVPHPFVADFDGNSVSIGFDILNETKYECPMCPFNDVSDLCWSPDGKSIAYVMKPSVGLEYCFKTRTDLFLYDVKTKWSDNLTPKSDHGYLFTPVFSPDGKKIIYGRMKRDGYESDIVRLCVYDIVKKQHFNLSESFDDNVAEFVWAPDSQTIYFTGLWHGHISIYKRLQNGKIEKLTNDQYDYNSIRLAGGKLIAIRSSLTVPDDLVSIDAQTKAAFQMTFVNKEVMSQIKFGKVEERWIDSHDNKKIHTYVLYPPDFSPDNQYPAVLICSGGPESMNSNKWGYRWNSALMASCGYIVVVPNRRGSIGFGLEWREDVALHFGGNAISDLLSAIDNVAAEPYVDSNRLGCVGASFGGYSCFYLESHHNKRFKCFIAHDGLFSFSQSYFETDEGWFAEFDIGAPWDVKTKPAVKQSYEYDPIKYVDQWDTPILVIHGEKDYRLRSSQGIQAFNAARMRGLDAKLLLFPDENHWCLQPQNSLLWHRVFFDWLQKYLK